MISSARVQGMRIYIMISSARVQGMHIYIITSGILLPYVFLVYALIKNYAGCNFHSAEDVPEIHFEKQFQCNLQARVFTGIQLACVFLYLPKTALYI